MYTTYPYKQQGHVRKESHSLKKIHIKNSKIKIQNKRGPSDCNSNNTTNDAGYGDFTIVLLLRC